MPLPGPRVSNLVAGTANVDPLDAANANVGRWLDQAQRASRTAHRLVLGLRQFAGSAMSAPLEDALEQVTESWSEVNAARQDQVAALIDRNDNDRQEKAALREQLRNYDRAMSAERSAHLLTLRELAARYKRAGKPIPATIAEAIDERDAPF